MERFMINTYEKNELLRGMGEIAELLFADPVRGGAISKVLANYVRKTAPSNQALMSELAIQELAMTQEGLKVVFEKVFGHIITVATEEVESGPFYTTGQLAKIFGVSITTISNWLKDGRFVGVAKPEKFKQVRVSESAYWRTPSGQLIQIKDLVDQHSTFNQSEPTKEQEMQDIRNSIAFFEKKYGGPYEFTLAKRSIDNMEAERDAREWRYLLSVLEDEHQR